MNGLWHSAWPTDRDFQFYYSGLEHKKLLVQRCSGCQTLRSPPTPMCGKCNSAEWTAAEMTGKGTLHSYTVHHHPPLPHFATPLGIGLIDLDEGVRVCSPIDGIPFADIRIGMRVQASFVARDKPVAAPLTFVAAKGGGK